MTAALIGVFVLHKFDADWTSYVALFFAVGFDFWMRDDTRKRISNRLYELEVQLGRIPQSLYGAFESLHNKLDRISRDTPED